MLRKFPDLALMPAPVVWRESSETRQPAAVPIGDTVTVDLGASGPLMGWARSRSPAEHAAELERLLIQELMPGVDEVIRSATAEIQRQASLISERCTAISVAVIEALRQRSESLIARAKELLDARDNRPAEEIAQAEKLASLRERVAVAEALSRRLGDLNARCSEIIA
jgi:hypothetical protein